MDSSGLNRRKVLDIRIGRLVEAHMVPPRKQTVTPAPVAERASE
jgi:hypothetical protein